VDDQTYALYIKNRTEHAKLLNNMTTRCILHTLKKPTRHKDCNELLHVLDQRMNYVLDLSEKGQAEETTTHSSVSGCLHVCQQMLEKKDYDPSMLKAMTLYCHHMEKLVDYLDPWSMFYWRRYLMETDTFDDENGLLNDLQEYRKEIAGYHARLRKIYLKFK